LLDRFGLILLSLFLIGRFSERKKRTGALAFGAVRLFIFAVSVLTPPTA
jgi:hypothetical protein